jgi:hypothetical protein
MNFVLRVGTERERDDCLIDDRAKNKQTSETKKCEKHTSIFSKKIAATRSRRKVKSLVTSSP